MCLRQITFFVLAVSFCESHRRSSDKCETDECQHVAKYFSDNMDPNVDPCKDFFNFTCGRFSKSNVFKETARRTRQQLLKTLTKDTSEGNDSMPFQKAKLFYSTCVNHETYKDDPILPIYQKMEELGGWPLKEDDDDPKDKNYLLPLVRKARQMGFDMNAIFAITILPNLRNTSERILTIIPPELIMDPQNRDTTPEVEEKIPKTYSDLMLMVAFVFLNYTDTDPSEETQREIYMRTTGVYHFEEFLSKWSIFVRTRKHVPVLRWMDNQGDIRYLHEKGHLMENCSSNDPGLFWNLITGSYNGDRAGPKMLDLIKFLIQNEKRMRDNEANGKSYKRGDGWQMKWEIIPKSLDVSDEVLKPDKVQTIADIQDSYPFLNWLEFIQAAFLGETTTIDSNEKVILTGEGYFDALQYVYNELTNKKIFKDYIVWRYIFQSLQILGVLDEGARWKRCLGITVGGFEPIVEANYIKNYFPSSNKELVVDLVNRSKKVMHETFQQYNWIDSAPKQNVLEKIDAIVAKVGYTDDMIKSETTQLHWFNSIVIDPDDLFASTLNLTKLSLDKHAASLREPVDRNQWLSCISTASVNAFYAPFENSITIPAALLQKEFFSPDRPPYLNYGSVGSIIGHELSHGFDSNGRFYDKFGNFNESLWDSNTTTVFDEKEECFIDMYSKYMLGSISLDGELTLSENMADNEGAALAYKAYKTWEEEKGAEQQLSGMNYTVDQMFWISMANNWCFNLSEASSKESFNTEPHAPAEFRVMGIVSNADTFSKAFECPIGSPMNPQTKCTYN